MTEIGGPWFVNTTEGLTSPHGLGVDSNGNVYVGEKVGQAEVPNTA